ncbi:hypothetical protein D3C76_1399830 [compost metagenome]
MSIEFLTILDKSFNKSLSDIDIFSYSALSKAITFIPADEAGCNTEATNGVVCSLILTASFKF